ncbi:MAG: helicase-exonuclease AddAB subunit AddA, partial [Ruminococcus sp.]|nr:helicase-exonuclease AddAB subunit AddA [Ruminococcus sp.]
ALLSKANISTIDSFCSSVVKEFFYILNIERNFRIADESELNLIKNDALKLTLDSMYADGEPDFFHLVEAFGSVKDDSLLQKNILRIHEFLRSHPFPDLWIDEKLSMFSEFEDVSTCVWSKIIINFASDACVFLESLINDSFDILSLDEKLNKSLYNLFDSDRKFLGRLSDAINSSKINDICAALTSFEKGTFVTPKGYKDDPLKIKLMNNRSMFKDTVSKLSDMFVYDEETVKKQIANLYVVSHQLFNCVRQFGINYQKLKATKKIADYPDLEHWTIKLLVDENTHEITEVAHKLRLRFDEIMVDEYQDANEAQDLIFSALSNDEKNLFFVGDVKQSIYGFRQAMPQLFLKRKDSSSIYDDNSPSFPAKIYLDKNFRSIKGVTDAVNFFFEKLMSASVGDIDYDDTESLKCGASYEESDEPSVSYHMLDLSSIEDPDQCVEEAKYIAQTIHRMIFEGFQVKDGDTYRNATFGDFSVLMRNANKYAPVYVDTLIACGVPAYCDSSYSFLKTHEIMVMTNFLSVIDNPALDIELLSVMMSPVYGFTPDDLASIRSNSRYSSLYSAVLKKADSGDVKCKNFIEELRYYRDLSVTMPVSMLINTIYERTGYLSIASALQDNELSVNNLRLLKEYAKNYEDGGNRGLSRFVSYIARLKENDGDISGAVDVTASSHNAVHVMSIHASKGLEFPVCFIANTNKKFVSDASSNVLLHSDLGIAIKQKDEKLNATFNTMPREALKLAIKRDEMSEELRVLYVAMTRAKQKLILISSHKNLSTYLKKISSNLTDSKRILPFVVQNCGILSEWITMCAMLHPDCEKLRELAQCDITPDSDAQFDMEFKIVDTKVNDDDDEVIESDEDIICEADNEVIDTLRKRVQYVYKKAALSKIPSKISASELSHKLSEKSFDRVLDTPAFMSDNTLSAAERGTAMHTFMQFSDFSSARIDIEKEISSLLENGYISKAEADSIDRKKALGFINSDIITRCLNSDEVLKEYRFSMKVDAFVVDDTLKDELKGEKIVLQGAVDLAFVEDGKLIVVDYKTDKVDDMSELYARYHNQLKIYKDAMEQCTDYKVKECLIYSLHLNKCIKV